MALGSYLLDTEQIHGKNHPFKINKPPLLFSGGYHINSTHINAATKRNPYNGLLGFVSVAGLIGNASVSEEGIMPLGYAFGTSTRTIAKDEVYEVGGVNGLFLFQDIASYGHWHIMFKAKDTLINLSNKAFGYLKLSVSGDKLVITNSSGGSARSATLIYQNISLFAK